MIVDFSSSSPGSRRLAPGAADMPPDLPRSVLRGLRTVSLLLLFSAVFSSPTKAAPSADAYASWRAENLPAHLFDSTISAPLAEPLGDGVPNLLRAAADADIDGGLSDTFPSLSVENGAPVFFYRQLSGGTGPTGIGYEAGGLRYVVETGDLSGVWRRGPEVLEQVGVPVPLDDRVELAAVRLKTPPSPDGRAFFRLRVDRPEPARRSDDLLEDYGVVSHLFRYSDYAAACDSFIASGVKWIRTGLEWNTLQPNPGQLPAAANQAQLAMLDHVVDRLTSNGVNIVFEIYFGADWCSSAPPSVTSGRRFYPPSDWDAWAHYVEFLTTRYRGKIRHWEVWNEPNLSTYLRVSPGQNIAEEYMKILTVASAKIRAADASNQVLLGGLASHDEGVFFDDILQRGAADHFDVIVYHVYGDNPHQVRINQGYRDVIDRHGINNRPVWITETGYTTNGDASLESVKSDRIHSHWLLHRRFDEIERIFWFLDRNDLVAGNSSESFRGLRANDRTPYPAYYYYQAMGGARVDFRAQTRFPAIVPADRTIYYSGTGIENYADDGSSKRIPPFGYMFFHVNDAWLMNGNDGLDETVDIEVTYLDSSNGGFRLDYDIKGSATAAQMPVVTRRDTGAWLTHVFTLTDVEFANSQAGGADFRIYAGRDAELVLGSVVVRKRTESARIKFGPVDRFHLVERIGEPDNPALTFQGETCRQLLNSTHYLRLRVSDGLVGPGDTRVRVAVRFWDGGTDQLRIEYNAADGATAKVAAITKTGSDAWRTVEVDLPDADFRNAGSWETDLRLSTGPDNQIEHISLVEITRLPLLDDDFEDGDADGWTLSGGAWSVQTGDGGRSLVQSSAGSGNAFAFTGTTSWQDYAISATVVPSAAGTTGLLARRVDGNNYYSLLADAADSRLILRKRVAGVDTTLIELPWDFQAGVPRRLRLETRRARLTAYVDDVEASSVHDVSLRTGRAGLLTRASTGSFDDVAVR